VRFLLFCWLLGSGLCFAQTPPPAPVDPPPLPPVDFRHLPWPDGESLTYMASLAGLDAAEGTFTAHQKGDHWEFQLSLASQGLVQSTYPFTAWFWSILGPDSPWRSVEYGEYRFEPKRTINERTRIDYAQHLGTRENWAKGETKTFPIDQGAIDDIGSMLYHIRACDWKPGDKYTVYVYENNSEKQGEISCEARETRAFGIWPAQPVLRIHAIPTKGTKRRGSLTIWMTDDARHLPLRTELDFLYGAFGLDLTKAEKTLPAGK
jgi:hypothetical protein